MENIEKQILGFERYFISSNGCVRDSFKNVILKKTNINGYDRVTLRNGFKYKALYVHRLMAIAFIDLVSEKNIVNHKNGIKNDNRLENLEWCSQKENIQHAWKNGKCSGCFGDRLKTQISSRKTVIVNGLKYDSIKIASMATGINASTISKLCNKRKISKKYSATFI